MKFRRKPIVVDAIKFEYTKDGVARLRNFAGKNAGPISRAKYTGALAEAVIIASYYPADNIIKHNFALEGDWIIKDENGEFYTCKPDRFYKEFEPITNKKVNKNVML